MGVISDTHGSLDPRVADVFAGVDRIVHAGDIGSAGVLIELETIAPVTAVLGNTDREIPGYRLPRTARLGLGDVVIEVAHDVRAVVVSPEPKRTVVAISGHTHVPSVTAVDGVLHVNPGAANRSRLPDAQRTVALLEITGSRASARIVHL